MKKLLEEQNILFNDFLSCCTRDLQVYSLQDSDKWDEIVKSFKDYDIYYLSGYLKCLKIIGDGEPLLFYYEDTNCRGINVVLKRDISSDKNFDNLEKNTYFDLTSPYGYGGWIIEGESTEKLFSKYSEWCKQNNIVAEFVRFHPLIGNQKACERAYDVIALGQVVAMDCTSEDVIWGNLSSKNRNQVKKSVKEGVSISIGKLEKLDRFIEIYEQTMIRNGAEDYYFFDREYYDCLFNELKDNAVIFSSEYQGETISSAIIFYCNDKANYHLSGATRKYNGLCESQQLLYEVAKWANKNNCKSFLLGGGVGSKEDSLYLFKKGFNKQNSYQFYIGKKIHNDEIYNKLVGMRKDIDNPNFFPKYRG